jgi:hypothetical protein
MREQMIASGSGVQLADSAATFMLSPASATPNSVSPDRADAANAGG